MKVFCIPVVADDYYHFDDIYDILAQDADVDTTIFTRPLVNPHFPVVANIISIIKSLIHIHENITQPIESVCVFLPEPLFVHGQKTDQNTISFFVLLNNILETLKTKAHIYVPFFPSTQLIKQILSISAVDRITVSDYAAHILLQDDNMKNILQQEGVTLQAVQPIFNEGNIDTTGGAVMWDTLITDMWEPQTKYGFADPFAEKLLVIRSALKNNTVRYLSNGFDRIGNRTGIVFPDDTIGPITTGRFNELIHKYRAFISFSGELLPALTATYAGIPVFLEENAKNLMYQATLLSNAKVFSSPEELQLLINNELGQSTLGLDRDKNRKRIQDYLKLARAVLSNTILYEE